MAFPGELGVQGVLALWAVILLAAVLRAFTGFGFALAAMPFFALMFAPADAVVLSAALALGIGLLTAPTFARDIPLAVLSRLAAGAVLGTLLGVKLLLSISPQVFLLGIGLAVTAASLVLNGYRPRAQAAGAATTLATGLGSGLLNGALAIPGPPVIIYALATQREPARARALLLGFFTLSALVALASYGAAGMINAASGSRFLVAFPAMVAGDYVGRRLFDRYSGRLYRTVAVAALLVIGLSASAKALLDFS
ncbi:MAG: sulfite exporter TauE/SafE family protein [Halioglobus sp.]|nr:sulfite exporter TauE/SafE family protein [Halioglobus sp.]